MIEFVASCNWRKLVTECKLVEKPEFYKNLQSYFYPSPMQPPLSLPFEPLYIRQISNIVLEFVVLFPPSYPPTDQL